MSSFILVRVFGLLVFASAIHADEVTGEVREAGQGHLSNLTAQSWLADWKAATLEEIRRVEQKPDLSFKTGLPPVWFAKIAGPRGASGHLMWEADEKARLVEFSFDIPLEIKSPDAASLAGVPPLQQFSLPEDEGPGIASGCVPTSAAGVLAFWIRNGHPEWRGELESDVEKGLAKRLRKRLKMRRFPDTDGFTEDGMALAGASPIELAKAIRADAEEHGVAMTADFHQFSFELLRAEIAAGRPVLLSCTVRVPHKPELSWGHEVAGVAWALIGGEAFVGFQDNFFPTRSPAAIRWVRPSAFRSLIAVRPRDENPPE